MDTAAAHKALHAYLARHEADMLALIERITNMDSFSHDGADVDAVGEVIATWLADAGFMVETLAKPPTPAGEPWFANLGHMRVARTHAKDAGAGIILPAHMDTVFPHGTCAARPFRMTNGRAYGPGTADMKAGLVMNLFAARAIKELGLATAPLTLTFTPDEELGSPTMPLIIGPHIEGAKAVLCTEPGFAGYVVTTRKGSGHMHITIHGKPAHSGRHFFDGVSAIQEFAHKAIAINTLVDKERNLTVNVGLVRGGKSTNAVADLVETDVHLSFPTKEGGYELEKGVRAITEKAFVPGTSATVTGGVRLFPMLHTAQSQKLFELVQQAGREEGLSLEGMFSGGAAETGYFSSVLGLPCVCCMGPDSAHVHTPEEYFEVASLLPRTVILALSAVLAGEAFA